MCLLRQTLLIVAGVMLGVICASGQIQAISVVAPSQTQQQSADPTNPPSSGTYDQGWRWDISPYIWFAGAHGTVGALGRDASVHASAGDLLSHLNVGLMGASEVQVGRFLLNGDLLWIRLSDGKALPFPGLNATSVDVRVGQFVWTSKIGYRLIDRTKFKADANVGARYWHLGQQLNLNPSILGLSINHSES